MQDATRMPSLPKAIDDEDEIDLRQYLEALIAWRWEILATMVAAALLAMGGVLAMRLLQPPVYKATATVVIARTSSNINFDDTFRTVLTEQNLTTAQRADVLVSTRRAALVGLVFNGAVAQSVAAALDASFDEEERLPSRLLERIEATAVAAPGSRTEGDLIRITASAGAPDKAAALANAWAHSYVEHVNRLYGQVPEPLMASVQSELAQAEETFQDAQRALEAFIADNQINLLERQIAEKQQIIASLQASKQTALQTLLDEELAAQREMIAAYIQASTRNRLLLFEKEQESRRALIAALLDADRENRLLAFQMEQEGRRKLFEQALQAEMENRALALAADQELRRQLFEAYAGADIRTRVAAFNEQVDARLQALAQSYATRQRLERLLDDARGLLAQVSEAGEAGAATNVLALLLLKSQVYSTGAAPEVAASAPAPALRSEWTLAPPPSIPLPTTAVTDAVQPALWLTFQTNLLSTVRAEMQSLWLSWTRAQQAQLQQAVNDASRSATPWPPLQLRLDDLASIGVSADSQVAELTTLVRVLEERIAGLNEAIEAQTQQILDNAGYMLVTPARSEEDPLFAAMQAHYAALFDVPALTDAIAASGALSGTVLARYEALFAPGPLVLAATALTATTPLLEAVQTRYPELFNAGELSLLAGQPVTDAALSALSAARVQELFELRGVESAVNSMAATPQLNAWIEALEQEIRSLQAQREAQISRRDALTRDRDLALKSFNTLKNKLAELQLASTALASEVRFGSPALPPLHAETRVSLAMAVALGALAGLILGMLVALLAHAMGKKPLLQPDGG
ncbi:Wzz/FepE/Etk N-terminal domain-containing protein [Caldilinea sp.]|uniref:Wzz/FepE/Etk N-terminal domain-containing protein n=1 Tax=Caldilinea sp. TaxID=2293560 RepID=UPI00262150AE|nr:Wzz/FepE/Etk N-terminal domain-containing protein [Caldilinea sp.]